MHVTLQSTQAAHSGRYGVLINVAKRFEQDWHAQVSLKGFTPPDTDHGYIFSFWGRAAADISQELSEPPPTSKMTSGSMPPSLAIVALLPLFS